MYNAFSTVLDNLIVSPSRSLAEVNADYSTMTEVADMLLRERGVPFRIGHHFASELTTFGRSHNLVPKDIPYADAARIYKDVTSETLPLTADELQHAFDPTYIVLSRRGLGGSQPVEVAAHAGGRAEAAARRHRVGERAAPPVAGGAERARPGVRQARRRRGTYALKFFMNSTWRWCISCGVRSSLRVAIVQV